MAWSEEHPLRTPATATAKSRCFTRQRLLRGHRAGGGARSTARVPRGASPWRGATYDGHNVLALCTSCPGNALCTETCRRQVLRVRRHPAKAPVSAQSPGWPSTVTGSPDPGKVSRGRDSRSKTLASRPAQGCRPLGQRNRLDAPTHPSLAIKFFTLRLVCLSGVFAQLIDHIFKLLARDRHCLLPRG